MTETTALAGAPRTRDGERDVRERFIERMGIVARSDGVPRIAGRMMGLLIFDGRPYSLGELALELQVGRGSIGTSARLLEQQGVIERAALPGDRQDYFQLAERPHEAVLGSALARSRRMLDIVGRTVQALPETIPDALNRRLSAFGAFHAAIIETLEKAISHGTRRAATTAPDRPAPDPEPAPPR